MNLKAKYNNFLQSSTTITNAPTILHFSPSIEVESGDWLWILAHAHVLKGSTNGSVILKVKQALGSADFEWLPKSGKLFGAMDTVVPANNKHTEYFAFPLECIRSGDATFGIEGQSQGSTSIIDTGGSAFLISVWGV